MEIVARPHVRNLVRFAEGRPEILVLSADLTASCEADAFRDACPDRFLSIGMAEQTLISMAGGLAREGFRPFVHTFAVFLCRRPFDQVAMSIAYPNLPVRLLGFLPGITTPGGVTHQATDDLALMRVLPNMTVLECGDATDVESALQVADSVAGPVYVRMLRGQVPRLFSASQPMRLGTARVLAKGRDVVVLSSGICTAEALRAVPLLRRAGVDVGLVHVSTLKPFSDPRVVDVLAGARHGVVSFENHSIIGGLGSATAELMAEQGIRGPLKRLGLQDVYAHGASRPYLMRKYGLDSRALVDCIEGLRGGNLGIADTDLESVDLPAPDEGRTEDL